MKFYFRWKLLTLTVSTVIVALVIYMALASQVFQKDKKAYIFDSSFNLVSQIREKIDLQIQNLHDQAKVLTYTYDFANNRAPDSLLTLFKEKKNWQLLSFWKSANQTLEQIIFLDKNPEASQADWIRQQVEKFVAAPDVVGLIPAATPGYLTALFKEKGPAAEIYVSTLTVRSTELLPALNLGSDLNINVVSDGGQVFNDAESPAAHPLVGEFIAKFPPAQNLEISTSFQYQKEMYLVSTSHSQSAPVFVMSATPQSLAFASLNVLYQKSVYVLVILICITTILTTFFSKVLTSNLEKLTLAAKKVSQGQLGYEVKVTSQDEFGSLGQNFNHMSREIKRLLSETADKARMESELKTAQTVQETLFAPRSFQDAHVQICGSYTPASECGGDWWFYFQKNSKTYLIVADATGHGVPAALITSAARAAVSVAQEREDLNIENLAWSLNRAIHDAARGNILMTGYILCYDNATRQLTGLNASHELPAIFNQQAEMRFPEIPNNPRLGQNKNHVFQSGTIEITSQDHLAVYTDGLTGLLNKSGKELGERRFLKILQQNLQANIDLNSALANCEKSFEEFREQAPLVDDLTLVFLKINV